MGSEAQKCIKMKEEFESNMDSMIKSTAEEGKKVIDKLESEKGALQAEIKNKDESLKCVHKEIEEFRLKYKETSQKLVSEAQTARNLKDEFGGIKSAVDSMKAKHKVDIDLKDSKIEKLNEQLKSSILDNQVKEALNEKIADLKKQLEVKTLQSESLSKKLEGRNNQVESIDKLYDKKIKEVESLTKLNEEKI